MENLTNFEYLCLRILKAFPEPFSDYLIQCVSSLSKQKDYISKLMDKYEKELSKDNYSIDTLTCIITIEVLTTWKATIKDLSRHLSTDPYIVYYFVKNDLNNNKLKENIEAILIKGITQIFEAFPSKMFLN